MNSLNPTGTVTGPPVGGSPLARGAQGHAIRIEVTPVDLERTLVRLDRLSRILDEAITIPGTSIRIGWDAVLGLIPVLGDAATTVISTYYLWEANRLGARKRVLVKMLGNVALDFVAGSVPLVGDLVDVAWRANRRNLNVLVREMEGQGRLPVDSPLLKRLRKAKREGPPPERVRTYKSRPFMLP